MKQNSSRPIRPTAMQTYK